MKKKTKVECEPVEWDIDRWLRENRSAIGPQHAGCYHLVHPAYGIILSGRNKEDLHRMGETLLKKSILVDCKDFFCPSSVNMNPDYRVKYKNDLIDQIDPVYHPSGVDEDTYLR